MARLKFGKFVGYAVLSWVLILPVATAQEQDAKSLLAELQHRHTTMANVSSLERLAARIVYIESLALLSEHGE